MGKENLYGKLNRIKELEVEKKGRRLTNEEQTEYNSLTRKTLYTLEELKEHHNGINCVDCKQFERALEKIEANIKNKQPWKISESLPIEIAERLGSLENAFENEMDYEGEDITLGDVLDYDTRTDLLSNLREDILSAIRQKYGAKIEEELYPIVQTELNSALDRYLIRNKTNINI